MGFSFCCFRRNEKREQKKTKMSPQQRSPDPVIPPQRNPPANQNHRSHNQQSHNHKRKNQNRSPRSQTSGHNLNLVRMAAGKWWKEKSKFELENIWPFCLWLFHQISDSKEIHVLFCCNSISTWTNVYLYLVGQLGIHQGLHKKNPCPLTH